MKRFEFSFFIVTCYLSHSACILAGRGYRIWKGSAADIKRLTDRFESSKIWQCNLSYIKMNCGLIMPLKLCLKYLHIGNNLYQAILHRNIVDCFIRAIIRELHVTRVCLNV